MPEASAAAASAGVGNRRNVRIEKQMPIYEESVMGLLLSPIVLMIMLSLVITSAVTRVIDKVIPWPLKRSESLVSMLLFTVILALMVSTTF